VPVNADQFRSALRLWASGVSIVTTRRDGEGMLGITVSSFSSLSLDPPLVVICIAREARSHDLIAARRAFAVNILREDQRPLSDPRRRTGGARRGTGSRESPGGGWRPAPPSSKTASPGSTALSWRRTRGRPHAVRREGRGGGPDGGAGR